MSAVQEWWPWYPWWDPHVQCWWWLVPNSSMPQSKVCRSSWGCRCLRGREARNPEIWREIECDLMEKNGNGFRVSPESVNSSLLPWMTINTENPESEIWLNSEGWLYGGGANFESESALSWPPFLRKLGFCITQSFYCFVNKRWFFSE